METKKEYVLGTGQDELNRLAIQHRVWADATTAVWKRAGIIPGSHVLDLGCGPGHATFDMAQLITEKGRCVGFDESPGFIEHLVEQGRQRGLTQIEGRVGDAQNLEATFKTDEKFDVIYCRWVLCWLKEPEKALAGMAKILKPGGRVVIHDYFNWGSMTLAPRSEAVTRMVQAALKSFSDREGDIDIAARLPNLLKKNNFDLRHFQVHQLAPRGGGVDGAIAWPLTWWRTYGAKLVDMGLLSKNDFDVVRDDLDKLEKSSEQFFVCPPLYEFMALKTP